MSSLKVGLVAVCVSAWIAACPAHDARAASLGSNIIANFGAEAGPGATSESVVVAVPKWQVTGKFTPVQYGVNGFPTSASPGPANRGRNFFAGGPGNALSSATQTINIIN